MKDDLNRNIYFLVGEDTDLIKEKFEAILKKRGLSLTDLDVEIFNHIESENEAITAIATPSLWGKQKVVWFKDFKILLKSKNEKSAKGNIIETLLKNKLPQDILVFSCAPADLKNKKTEEIKKISNFHEIKMGDDWRYLKANEIIEKEGKNISKNALSLLCDSTSNDTKNFYNEMEKLILFVGPAKQNIDLEDVTTIVTSNHEEPFFKLAEDLLNQNSGLFFKRLKKLLHQGESPNGLLINLVNNLRFLMQTCFLAEEGFLKRDRMSEKYSESWINKCISEIPEKIIKLLPQSGNVLMLHPYRIYLFLVKSKKLKLKAVRDIFLKTYHAYWEIVSSRMPETAMSKLLF